MTSAHPFDLITPAQLRAIGSTKWTAHPGKTPAWVAEMDFGVAPPIASALHEAVDNGAFGYLPEATCRAMREALAGWSAERYGWAIDQSDVKPVPDVLAAFEAAIEHFSAPGSAIVLPTPAYMPFFTIPPVHSRRIIQVPMIRTETSWEYDLDALDAAFADGGGLLVLCNPHNPIGRVLRPDELVAIGEVVDRHGARVFADEIHAPLVYSGHTHTPYASVNEVNASHTLTATSASKAFNLPGLKAAQVVLSNDADRAYWADNARALHFEAANLGVVANTAAYTAGGEWLAGVIDYLDGNRHLVGELVAEHLPGARYVEPEGTYLAWVDCAALELPGTPAAFFSEHADVFTTDGAACGDGAQTAFRFNFATPRPVIRQAFEAMGEALRAHRA